MLPTVGLGLPVRQQFTDKAVDTSVGVGEESSYAPKASDWFPPGIEHWSAALAAPENTISAPRNASSMNGFTEYVSQIGNNFPIVGNFQLQPARFLFDLQLRGITAGREVFDVKITVSDGAYARAGCG